MTRKSSRVLSSFFKERNEKNRRNFGKKEENQRKTKRRATDPKSPAGLICIETWRRRASQLVKWSRCCCCCCCCCCCLHFCLGMNAEKRLDQSGSRPATRHANEPPRCHRRQHVHSITICLLTNLRSRRGTRQGAKRDRRRPLAHLHNRFRDCFSRKWRALRMQMKAIHHWPVWPSTI